MLLLMLKLLLSMMFDLRQLCILLSLLLLSNRCRPNAERGSISRRRRRRRTPRNSLTARSRLQRGLSTCTCVRRCNHLSSCDEGPVIIHRVLDLGRQRLVFRVRLRLSHHGGHAHLQHMLDLFPVRGRESSKLLWG